MREYTFRSSTVLTRLCVAWLGEDWPDSCRILADRNGHKEL